MQFQVFNISAHSFSEISKHYHNLPKSHFIVYHIYYIIFVVGKDKVPIGNKPTDFR